MRVDADGIEEIHTLAPSPEPIATSKCAHWFRSAPSACDRLHGGFNALLLFFLGQVLLEDLIGLYVGLLAVHTILAFC